MGGERSIEIAIQKLAGTYLKDIVSIQACTVDSVDEDNRVCDCTPIGGDATTSIPGVQLCAENNNGLVVFPVVGSTVIVAQSTRNNTFVLMFSDIANVQFMDGTYGGLAKTEKLKDKYNVLENQANAIKTIVSAILAAGSSSPATPVTNATLAAYFAGFNVTPIVLTTQIEIENDLITHGTI